MIKKAVLKIINKLGYSLVKNRSLKKSIYSKELVLHKTKTGKYFLPKHAYSDVVVQAIASDLIFDEPVVELALKYIKGGTTVLDVGANFGQMTILFSQVVGKDGLVYTFEADDFIYEVLEKNINENDLKNIRAFYGAVHDKSDEVLYFPIQDFERFGTYGSYGIDYKNHKGRAVKTISIDSLNIKTPISFMKIDVQGGDLFALKGAKNTILEHKMPVLFEYEYLFEEELNFNFQQYVDFVNEIGYKFERVINGHNFLITPK